MAIYVDVLAQLTQRAHVGLCTQLDALQRKGRALPGPVQSANEHADPKIGSGDAGFLDFSGHAGSGLIACVAATAAPPCRDPSFRSRRVPSKIGACASAARMVDRKSTRLNS